MKDRKSLSYYSLIVFVFILINKQASAQTEKEIEAHRAKWGVPASADADKNPFAGNAAITDTGKVLYKKACSVCHGDKGKGDGVAAAGLAVRPADHTANIVQAQTDGALFYELNNGRPPMPGFKAVFSEKQRWALINYIRTLAKPKPDMAKPKSSNQAPTVKADNK